MLGLCRFEMTEHYNGGLYGTWLAGQALEQVEGLAGQAS